MKLLNLGCGQRYHQQWINLDFVSNDENVIAHNLLNGIPFADNSIDVVYHSHVLEHFSRADGRRFIEECFRVLKDNGVIRIAVPDLEMIVKEYQRNFSLALAGDAEAASNYEWIMLELYDQTVRNTMGGDMAAYLFQKEMPNEEYVYSRIGEEGRSIRNRYKEKELAKISEEKAGSEIGVPPKNGLAQSIRRTIKKIAVKLLLKNEMQAIEKFKKETEIGHFRLGGEIHQWMYDRYSLSKLLREVGFDKVEVKDNVSSGIPNWTTYGLEANSRGTVFKPDSLFIEAVKGKRDESFIGK